MGLGVTVALLLLLARTAPVARADPGIYYVREGVIGDCISVTTPCSSVQYAINLAVDPGDEVRVATGTYTENLVITRGLSLRGGWDISFSVQSPVSYPATLDGSGEHVISVAVGTDSALIEGFTVRNGRDGIHLYSGALTVTNNVVYSMSKQGVEVTTGTVWVEGNTIASTAEEGISVNGGTGVVAGNLVYDTGIDGIHTGADCVSVEIRGNTVYSTASDGIDGRGQSVVIVSNTTYDVGKDGIHVEDAGAAVVQYNTAYSTTERGIYARNGAPSIAGNIVHDTSMDGIRTHSDCTDVTVHGNTVSSTTDDCVEGRGTTVTVTSNVVSGCADNGVKAEQADQAFVNANQVYGAAGAGVNLDDAGVFTVTNNIVASCGEASVLVDTAAGPYSFLYHNTLVGSATGQQGTGISVTVPGITITLVNNIVVSHAVGITDTAGATLIVSKTLLWGNGSDPITGTGVITGAPLFVAPAVQDYHVTSSSPAVDAGIEVGVPTDVDGDPRISPPDVGADEFVRQLFLPLILRNLP